MTIGPEAGSAGDAPFRGNARTYGSVGGSVLFGND